jgi:hypothetical protein
MLIFIVIDMAMMTGSGSFPACMTGIGMCASQDSLHGVTLKMMLTQLEEKYDWEELVIRVVCRPVFLISQMNSRRP